jgi:hypothetical protein
MSEEDEFVVSEEESDFEESAVVMKKKPLQENRNVTNSTTTTKKTKNVEETYQKLSQLEVRVCVWDGYRKQGQGSCVTFKSQSHA